MSDAACGATSSIRIWFTGFRAVVEVLSFLAVILTLPLAYWEYRANLKKERLEAGWGIYREVDHIYRNFASLCFANPWLDCYSQSIQESDFLTPKEKSQHRFLTAEQKLRQRIMYDNLTDVFEVAYVHYCKFRDDIDSDHVRKLFNDQWAGWASYIHKLVNRHAYVENWKVVHDEYDVGLQRFIDLAIKDPKHIPDGC
jgi:hypothetical protein